MRVSGRMISCTDVYLNEDELKCLPTSIPKPAIQPKSDIRGNGTWWTEQDKKDLRKYMNEGLKYAVIGRLLRGGRTRQAVKRRVQRFRAGVP